jgi:hypothetical protein
MQHLTLFQSKLCGSKFVIFSKNTELIQLNSRFARRSDRFMDAYRKGLDGIQAVWASKRYRGHRVLPKNIMELFDKFFKRK